MHYAIQPLDRVNDQNGYIQYPLDDEGSRHPHGRRPKLAVKPQDAKRIARPERRRAVDRHPREKRPRTRAE